MADTTSFTFAGGESKAVPGSYIEFAERLVLPEFRHLDAAEVRNQRNNQNMDMESAGFPSALTFSTLLLCRFMNGTDGMVLK